MSNEAEPSEPASGRRLWSGRRSLARVDSRGASGDSTTRLAAAASPREGARGEIYKGLAALAAFALVLFGWASFAHLDAAVYAQGQIVVAGNRQAVQHREGGIVTELDVAEGDRVHTGQVLLRLNAGELLASERAAAAQVISLKALSARLLAELQGAPSFNAPAEFASLTGEDRKLADAAMILQRREFSTRALALVTQKQVLTARQKQSTEQINGFERQRASNREQQRLIKEEVDGIQGLLKRGLVPQTRARQLERSAADLTGTEGAYNASIARTQEEIGESRIRIAELDRDRAAEDSKDLRSAQFQLADLEPKLAAVRQQIERTIVRSPANGKVVGLTIFTVGGVVAPGQKLMDIVPEDQPLVLEAKVKPTDVDDLRVGQTTEIKITAFHDRSLPVLRGVVSKVSADAFTDEKTGASYFRIEATVPPAEVKVIRDARGADAGLKPGLPVQVVVPLRSRTALQYLIEPLQQMLWRSFREH